MSKRVIAFFASLCGVLGVVFSALAAHSPFAAPLVVAGQFLLFHAPVLLLIALALHTEFGQPQVLCGASIAFGLGLLLFAGSIFVRAMGWFIVPYAAPIGGFMLMAGWTLLAQAIILPLRR